MYPPSTEQKSEASSLPLRNSADAAEALSLGHANVKTITAFPKLAQHLV